MSLLQEALKRKEQDKPRDQPDAGAGPGTPAATPAVPPDTPSQSIPVLNQLPAGEPRGLLALAKSGRRKSAVLWVIVALMAIFISATITAGFVYFFHRLKPSSKEKVVQTVPPVVPPAPVSPASPDPVEAKPAPEQASVTVVPGAQKEPADTNAPAPAQTAQTSAAPQPAAAPGEQKPVAAQPPALRSRGPAAPAAKWPLLKLSGILRGSGQNANTALINGKMINIGQTIENVTLVEIQSDGVILKFGEEKRFLRVGAISY